jgi:hypothetical protein
MKPLPKQGLPALSKFDNATDSSWYWIMIFLRFINNNMHSFSHLILPVITFFISVFVFEHNSEGSSVPEPVTIFVCASQEIGIEGEIFIPIQFLQLREIEDELGITDAQLTKINELIKTTKSEVFEPYAKRNFHSVAFDEIRRQLDEARRMIVEIMRPDQMASLKSLIFLRYGLWSLTKRDMRDILHVTKIQTVKIDEIRARMLSRIYASAEIHDRGSSDKTCRMIVVNNKTEMILADSEQSVLKTFTTEQRETLNKLREKSSKTSIR